MTTSMQGKAARRITAAEAAALVKSGDWVDYGAVLSQPDVFDRALADRKHELREVKIRSCLSLRPRAVLEVDPRREHFHWYSWHFGGYDRKKHDAGLCHYIPCNLGEISDYYRRFIEPPDILVLKTRAADANGFFNLGAAPSNLEFNQLASLGFTGTQRVRDLWRQSNLPNVDATTGNLKMTIPVHGVVLYRLKAVK